MLTFRMKLREKRSKTIS